MSRVRGETSYALGGGHLLYSRYLEPFYLQSGAADSAAASANRCWYSPIRIPFVCTVDGVIAAHSGTAGGNIMTGFYDSTSESPTDRLAVSNVYACNGTLRRQFVEFTGHLQVSPGYYFLATWSSTTDTYFISTQTAYAAPTGVDDGPSFYFEAAGAGGPPATATPTQADAANETVWMLLRVHSVP